MPIDIGDLSFFNKLQLVKEDWMDWEWDEIDWWKPFSRGVSVIDGPIRGGKTTYLVVSSFKFKKYFGQGVIFDNPRMIKPGFGRFQQLDWLKLIASLGVMAKKKDMPKYMVLSQCLDGLFRSVGVDLYNKTINIDEASKVLNKRRGQTDVVLIIGQMARQIAHFGSLLQISSQDAIKGLDQHEGIGFKTALINCEYDQNERKSYYSIKSKFTRLGPGFVYPLRINPDNWKDIYESFSRVQEDMSVRELVKTGGRK